MAAAGLLAGGVATALAGTARRADRRLNPVAAAALPPLRRSARDVHARIEVADLHADTLLWPRDLLRLHQHGHVDLPRLLAGRVGVQVFSVVTGAPANRDLSRGVPSDARDAVTLLSIASGRAPRTWRSRSERALDQAARLHRAAERSGGLLRVARSASDLRGPQRISGVLAVEGMHALDGDLANVDALYEAGFRMFGLAHLHDNDVAGSSTGRRRHGLTSLGREVVDRVERLGGLLDLAHASRATIDDVLSRASGPVVVSHTGVRATVRHARNLADAHIRAVADTGGLIGIGLWPEAVGEADPAAAVRALRHVAGLVGTEHVALGSDFDGTVAVPFDASGWQHLTAALLADGFDEAEIAAIMGGNARRLLQRALG